MELRDKIARALGAGLEDHERPVFAGRQLEATQAAAIADAVLAVLDLDTVRAEAQVEALRHQADATAAGDTADTLAELLIEAERERDEARAEVDDLAADPGHKAAKYWKWWQREKARADRAEAALERVRAAATEVADHWGDQIGTHYDGCWRQHAACLAAQTLAETGADDA